jgi:hypothetical protein
VIRRSIAIFISRIVAGLVRYFEKVGSWLRPDKVFSERRPPACPVRVSLANLGEDTYPQIGHYLRETAQAYLEEWQAAKEEWIG